MRTLALLFLVSACRADVSGWWVGDLGGDNLGLSLDQAGSKIDGEACIGEACNEIDEGALEEDSLTLTFGCGRCALPQTTLELTVFDSELEGEARRWECSCVEGDAACACRLRTLLHRCDGSCGPRRR